MSENKTASKHYIPVILFIAAVLAVILLANSCFIVTEYETVLVKRFGSIDRIYIKEAPKSLVSAIERSGKYRNVKVIEGSGLKLKFPFIDSITRYSHKLLTYDTQPREVITADKKKLLFDNNAQWVIDNALFFDITMGSIAAAQTRIDDILYSRMNEKVGKLESSVMISDKATINRMLGDLAVQVSKDLKSYGISIFDIRIKRTDVPEENHKSIYNRMITERNRMAMQYRSEGEEESIKIKSDTDKQVSIILSTAQAQAEKLKGEGDAKAAQIYNKAYSSNPDFFKFYNTLETYKQTIGSSSTLIIPLDSPFAQYLLGGK